LVNETNPRLVKYGNCPQFTPVIPVTLGISQTYRGHLTNPHVSRDPVLLTRPRLINRGTIEVVGWWENEKVNLIT
jgi:hypothetical protein